VNPRLAYPEYTPGLNAAQRAAVNNAAKAPAIRSAEARVASLRAGVPQLISHRGLPPEVTEGIAWLQDRQNVTSAERDESCVLVRIYADDVVDVGQTVAQEKRKQEVVAQGFPVGRVDIVTGQWIPCAVNPATGEWEDADPVDIIAMRNA
jgi:hypothetical protein